MLVSLMARLNAISQMHNAQWAMMQNNMAMMNLCRSLPSFGGNLAMLNHMDAQFAMSNAQNQLLYQIASAQEKAAAARISQELKDNKISYIA
jgi:hypothetical protein